MVKQGMGFGPERTELESAVHLHHTNYVSWDKSEPHSPHLNNKNTFTACGREEDKTNPTLPDVAARVTGSILIFLIAHGAIFLIVLLWYFPICLFMFTGYPHSPSLGWEHWEETLSVLFISIFRE